MLFYSFVFFPLLLTSYFFEDERGLFPEVEFVCDLKLSHDFQPVNSDGEVGEFYCWSMDKVCWLNIMEILLIKIKNLFGPIF